MARTVPIFEHDSYHREGTYPIQDGESLAVIEGKSFTRGRKLGDPGDYAWVLELDACVAAIVEHPEGLYLAAASRGLIRALNLDAVAVGGRLDEVLIAGLPLSMVVAGVFAAGAPVDFTTEIRSRGGRGGRFAVSVRPARAG